MPPRPRHALLTVASAFVCALSLAGCRGEPARAPSAAAGSKAAIEGEVLQTTEPREASATLRKVRARGRLNCGVAGAQPGFSFRDPDDAWRGFDVDFCRAVAAAVLGDPRAVNFTALDSRTRFAALQSGVVDLVSRNTAWTYSRDAAQGVDFVGVSFYDSQGFLAAAAFDAARLDAAAVAQRKAAAAPGQGGLRVCVPAGSTTQLTLSDWFRAKGVDYTPVPADGEAEAVQFFQAGACDLLTGTRAALAAARLSLPRPDDYLILPQVVSKEPSGPMVREGDPGWTDVVQWTLHALILADEFGLTSANVGDARRDDPNPEVRRLLGAEGAYGPLLGLRKDWAQLIISRVGGYAEVFDRNLGAGSDLKLERGQNAAWNAEAPGLLYAPPMR